MSDVLTPKPTGDTQRDLAARGVWALVTATASVVTYAMNTRIRHLEIITITSYGMAVTLPPVAECAGMIFSVTLRTYVDTAATIADYGDDALFTSRTLNATGEFWVGMSNGVRWLTLTDVDASASPSVL